MLQPNDRYNFDDIDASFSEKINNSDWLLCQGCTCDRTMLREAMSTTDRETEKAKSNSARIIQWEIAVNLFFLSIVLISQLISNSHAVSNSRDARAIEQHKLKAY